MDLFKKIERIIYNEGISLTDFYEKTGFSKSFYYSIKKGLKTKLKPSQARLIVDAFPNYTYEWLMGEVDLINETTENNGSLMDLAKDGKLGIVLNDNHEKLLNIDKTYKLWFDNIVLKKALNILKDNN